MQLNTGVLRTGERRKGCCCVVKASKGLGQGLALGPEAAELTLRQAGAVWDRWRGFSLSLGSLGASRENQPRNLLATL